MASDFNEYEYLCHHGILGMKWGVRRYQNKDGSLTSAGKSRYMTPDKSDSAVTKRVKNDYNTLSDQEFMNKYKTSKQVYAKRVEKYGDPYMNSPLAKLGKRLHEKKSGKKFTDADAERELLNIQKTKKQQKAEKKIASLEKKRDRLLSSYQKDLDSIKANEESLAKMPNLSDKDVKDIIREYEFSIEDTEKYFNNKIKKLKEG